MNGTGKTETKGKIDIAMDDLQSEISTTENLVRGLEDRLACLLNPSTPANDCEEKDISNDVPLLGNINERIKRLSRINNEFRKILDRIEL